MNWFSSLANPDRFMRIARFATPILGVLALANLLTGAWWSLTLAPADYQQGEAVRMMYVHVPAAWMSMGVYAFMTIASITGFVWRHQLADFAAREAALPGLVFTFLALVTGSLWGKTTWGVWWDWDARMTSMLVLLFIYAGYITLWRVMGNPAQAARLAAIFCMLGAVNLPIIKFSVDFWETLHQKASMMREEGPAMPPEMYTPLLIMAVGYLFFFGFIVLLRLQTVILQKRNEAPGRPVSRPVGATVTATDGQSKEGENNER